jgi:hypothetical protein
MSPRAAARTLQDLIVWQKAYGFVLIVYRYTLVFRNLKLTAWPISSERLQFRFPPILRKAFAKEASRTRPGSSTSPKARSKSADTILILSRDLEYGDNGVLMQQLEEVSRILDAYGKAILTPDS